MQFTTKFINFDTINSTNIWCKNNTNLINENTLLVVQSEKQSNGIGRSDRKWLSSKGGLYLSLAFKLPTNNINIPALNILVSLCVKDILKNSNIKVKIKWPNDIILNNKKIGGILSELVDNKREKIIIIGIGLNFYNDDIVNLDRPLYNPSTIFLETNNKLNIEKFKLKFVDKFISKFNLFCLNGLSYFLEDFKKFNILKNKNIDIKHENIVINGKYHSISENGSLNLINQGVVKNFINGDILRIY